jgi:hypothetical protein
MKNLNNPGSSGGNYATVKAAHSQKNNLPQLKGFSKVVAGGRVIRMQKEKPFLERLVTGHTFLPEIKGTDLNSIAVLESIQTNLEAGIDLVDCQETGLAKIGGRLSEVALTLNQADSPRSKHEEKEHAQVRFEEIRTKLRELAQLTYDGTALFSIGKAKPITIAVPSIGRWEGLSIDRADLGQPGMVTIDKGKVFGNSSRYHLDADSVKRACDEWRSLCMSNRMQWGLLKDRLKGIVNCLLNFDKHRPWKVPVQTNSLLLGSLRRPNQNN